MACQLGSTEKGKTGMLCIPDLLACWVNKLGKLIWFADDDEQILAPNISK